MLGRNGLMLNGEWRLLRRKREEAGETQSCKVGRKEDTRVVNSQKS